MHPRNLVAEHLEDRTAACPTDISVVPYFYPPRAGEQRLDRAALVYSQLALEAPLPPADVQVGVVSEPPGLLSGAGLRHSRPGGAAVC